MKGLVLSEGRGIHLLPFTLTRARQLIPVANKPVLVRVIEALRDAGVEEIGVVVGQTASEIQETLGDGRRWNVSMTYIQQLSPDGPAHAVKISQDFLGDEPFVMCLGDNVIQGGISRLIRDFAGSDWNSQIILKEVPNPSAYGVAVLRPDGSIERLVEKPQTPPGNLALVGIYMFDSHIFEALQAVQPSAGGKLEITDAIQWLIEHGYRVYPHLHQGWWIDTRKATDLLDASSHLLEELKPTIAPDATIENSQVDSRVTLQNGAKIINSVIRGPTIIGMSTVIENSYIGPFTSIYHHVRIQNCEIERSIILENSEVSDIEPLLRDSIIGRDASIRRENRKPRGLKMNLGDHSKIWI